MARFPNQDDQPVLRIRGQSASMGPGVSMRNILTLSVCPSGLRVGIMRVFGPFCRDFFVPWDSISVCRETRWFEPMAKLEFGKPVVGTLRLRGSVANRLARAAAAHWPEAGPFPEEPRSQLLRRLFIQWAVITCAAALFFTLVPRILAPRATPIPILDGILFPAIVFGLATIVRFFCQKG
jgi:hypothetical protein